MAWAAETEQSLTPDILVQGKSLGDLLTRYRNDITPTKKSNRNETNRINRLLRDSLSDFLLLELRQSHFHQRIENALKIKKSSSVNSDLILYSAVFEQGILWEWTSANPICGIRRPKNPEPRDRRISDKEIERILHALGFDGENETGQRHTIAIAIAFLFALETAMYQGEIWNLEWDDVGWTNSTSIMRELLNISQAGITLGLFGDNGEATKRNIPKVADKIDFWIEKDDR